MLSFLFEGLRRRGRGERTPSRSRLSPTELKKNLVAAGFEIYRILGQEVLLADRVRENLIMDSGVRVRAAAPFEVSVALRVRKTDYPHETDEALFAHARALGARVVAAGFAEREAQLAPVTDPADPARVLDTFYEVVFARTAEDVAAAIEAAKVALEVAKTAEPR